MGKLIVCNIVSLDGYYTIDKVVVSDSLTAEETVPWRDTTRIVSRADAHQRVAELKRRAGGDVLVFGSHALWTARETCWCATRSAPGRRPGPRYANGSARRAAWSLTMPTRWRSRNQGRRLRWAGGRWPYSRTPCPGEMRRGASPREG